MKFTPEVIAAIQTLRDNAENDFELHRIDVLERDLTAPPQVEVIDGNHQRFNGIIYREDSGGHYENDLRIHRAVWQYYYGDIPDGYQIHHVDHNKSNNNISNLQCLTKIDHRKAHAKQGAPVAKPKIKAFICEHCGKEYQAPALGRNRYCSKECKDQHKYAENMVIFICQQCGKEFLANRHNAPKFCSHHCSQANRYQGRRTIRKCLVCGKEFETTFNQNKICCSNRCAAILRERNKKANQTES